MDHKIDMDSRAGGSLSNRLILLILDGWGWRESAEHNAVRLAQPMNFNNLMAFYPHILLDASGKAVGLPAGQMGNSEVGHMNLGAGRVVYQDLLRITKAFDSGAAAEIPVLKEFLQQVHSGSGRLHLAGLLSDGGVHSHMDHFKGLIALASAAGIREIYIHPFTDGRDTPPRSGLEYIQQFQAWLNDHQSGAIADVCGRFYAMDRDKRWDRVEKAYNMLRFGSPEVMPTAVEAMEKSYAEGITDEFVTPVTISGVDGTVRDGDCLIFVNFRADRVRELLAAFYKDDFDGFDRGPKPQVSLVTMTEYDDAMPVAAIFPSETYPNILGQILSESGLKQLRIAETEKYAHVTYFFNGGVEEPFEGESRKLIPSPRDVATYDLKPRMSVEQVEAAFEEIFVNDDIDVVVMNFANPDMVGHTGVENAAVEACQAVDNMLGRVMEMADRTGAVLMVTADHGNSEQMWDDVHNQPHTSHTTNPVPFIIYNYPCRFVKERGRLADVAPTMLKILGINVPLEMDGDCLID